MLLKLIVGLHIEKIGSLYFFKPKNDLKVFIMQMPQPFFCAYISVQLFVESGETYLMCLWITIPTHSRKYANHIPAINRVDGPHHLANIHFSTL